MLYPQPGEGTIHRLLPESFLWHKGNKLKGITQLLLAATTSSPRRFNPPNNDSSSSGDALNFYGAFIFFGKEKQRAQERAVWWGSVCAAIPGVMSEKSVSHF